MNTVLKSMTIAYNFKINGHTFRYVRQGHMDMSDEGAVKTVYVYSFYNN